MTPPQEIPIGGGDILTVDPSVAAPINAPATMHRVSNPGALCGASKPFLAELQDGLFPSKGKVKYEWMPIVPGSDPRWPTLAEHHLYVAGTIKEWTTPGNDVPFAHPFGNDCSADILVDELYANLVYDGPEPPGVIHAELESGLFPHFPGDPPGCGTWISPVAGDRIIELGDWILDCGHPESYGSEIHPPSVMAIAHLSDDGARTEARAFAIPYRTTQLYGKDGAKASDLDNVARFGDGDVKPFPDYFQSELVRNLTSEDDHIVVHPMIERQTFGTVAWSVCAPAPRPANAAGLTADWHFTTRSAVAVTGVKHDDTGCVTFTATQSASYKPVPIVRHDHAWPWCNPDSDNVCNAWSVNAMTQDVSQNCELDVLAKVDVIGLAVGAAIVVGGGGGLAELSGNVDPFHALAGGLTWAVVHSHLSRTPVIDQYDPLVITAPADRRDCLGTCRQQRGLCRESDDPRLLERCNAAYTACTSACQRTPPDQHIDVDDSQPFPFYGTATVAWATTGQAAAIARAELTPPQVSWTFRDPAVTRPLTLTNVGSADFSIAAAGITGPDRGDFAIASDGCSGKKLAPHEACTMSVLFKRGTGISTVPHPKDWHRATLAFADSTGGTLGADLAGWEPICVPRKACVSGSTCGTESDGCGGTINCGSCKAGANLCMDDDTGTLHCASPKAACQTLCARARARCQTATDPNILKQCGPGYTTCTKACNGPPPPYVPPVCTRARVQLQPGALSWTRDHPDAIDPVVLTDISTKPVVVSKVSITGADAASFSIVADGCTGKRLAVPAGTCTVTVGYTPTVQRPGKPPEAALTFDDDGWESPQSVPLVGVCTPRTSCVAGATCGTQDDGCGTGTISCGTCRQGQVCTTGGRCTSPDSRAACTTACQHTRESCTESGDVQLLKRCTSTYRTCLAGCSSK